MKKSVKISILIIIIIGFTFVMAQLQEKGIINKPKKETVVEETKKKNTEIKKVKTSKEEEIEREENYKRNIKTIAGTLSTEIKCVFNAINKSDIKLLEIHSDNIVYSARHMKKITPPLKHKETKKKIDNACDIYIEVYSQLSNKLNDDNWIKEASNKINKANKLINEATNFK